MVLLHFMGFLVVSASLQAVVGSALYRGDACDDENEDIISREVLARDAPYIAALYFEDQLTNDYSEHHAYCGGSIIHKRFVLTAAHCIYFVNLFHDKPAKKVLLGANRLNVGGLLTDVEEEFCHKGFIASNYVADDICLLKLKEAVPFGRKVGQVELPEENFDLEAGTLVNVTGFDNSGANKKKELRQATIPIVTDKCCRKIYEGVKDTQFCAASREQGACIKGDSGGPLTYKNMQIGVISFGQPCSTSQPAVYTRITSYLNWIKTNYHRRELVNETQPQ